MKLSLIQSAGTVAAFALLFGASPPMRAQGPFGAPTENSAFSIPQAQVIQPEELNRTLHAGTAEKPLMLQVGSRVLFDQAHIPGSEYAGPGSQPAGFQQLQNRIARLPRETPIVLYCGCCPWNRCPNVAPAFRLLQRMGFTQVKVLYLADNFGADWVSKGYPVERTR